MNKDKGFIKSLCLNHKMAEDLFCKLYSTWENDRRVLFEGGPILHPIGEHSVAMLSLAPIAPGQIMFIPKQHGIYTSDFSSETLMDLAEMEKRAREFLISNFGSKSGFGALQDFYQRLKTDAPLGEASIVSATKVLDQMERLEPGMSPTGFTAGENYGLSGGQRIIHYHRHVVPRWGEEGLGFQSGLAKIIERKNVKK